MKNAELIKNNLASLNREGRLSHAYIFESLKTGQLNQFGMDLARTITPFTEDIFTVSAEGLSVKDKAIESLIERLYLKPLVGERNIAIVQDADTITLRAQNRLLKTLEEPPGKAVLFLLCKNAENLLATIRSRCVRIRVDGGAGGDIADSRVLDYAQLIGKSIVEGKGYFEIADVIKEIAKEKSLVLAFLDEIEKWYRDALFSSMGISAGTAKVKSAPFPLVEKEKVFKAISLIEMARNDINRHLNSGYVIKNMILQMT